MKATVALSALVALAGCASLSEDAGFSKVEQAVKERADIEAKWARSEDDATRIRGRVKGLLAGPLGPAQAMQIAVLNNPGLQASYAEVGIAEADLVQASRSRLEATQSRVAAEALRVAFDARKAWFEAVAAQETAGYAAQLKDSAEASAELARRMAAVGNFPKLTQAREQAFYADATTQLARARHKAAAARERLTRLMGLWGGDLSYQLPDRLPELPKEVREGGELEAQAIAQRLDVQRARREAESLAHAKAERLYLQAVNRATEAAVQARSEVREAYSSYRTAFDIARHYRDEIVPLRKRISEEVLLRYNGMLMSVFELLADSREQVAAVNGYIEAARDFWLAEADLQMALTGGGH